jgi:hypothetical protein
MPYTDVEDDDVVLQIITEVTFLHSRISDNVGMPKHVGAKIRIYGLSFRGALHSP